LEFSSLDDFLTGFLENYFLPMDANNLLCMAWKWQSGDVGAPTAINAGANKLARLFYRMLKFGAAYVEQGQTYYEQRYKDRLLHNLSKRAKESTFSLLKHRFSSL
jgi:hypothetical protein